jgi:hypothetical protein
MTPEEMAAAISQLNSKLGKMTTSIEAMEAAAQSQDDEIERLRGANTRLLRDLKKAKVKVSQSAEDDEDIGGDDADDAPKPKAKKGVEAELAALKAQLDASSQKLAKKAIEQAIKDALDTAKVSPQHRKAVAALLRAEMEFEADEDGNVTVGDKSAADAIAAWSKTDDGKQYVSAPASGGSGGKPSKPGAQAPSAPIDANGKRKSDFSIAQRGRFIREVEEAGGDGAKAWAALPA